MIPTAILAGLILGVWLRWWAVPVVAAGWAVVIGVASPSAVPVAAALGALNALVGAAPAVALRRLVSPRRRPAGHP